MAIYKFRSRYGNDDTSHLLPENQPRSPNSLCWACIIFSFRLSCSSRIRCFTSVVVLLALTAAGHNASSIWNIIDNQSQTQSRRQSAGYVDVPKWKWKSQKDYFRSIHAKPYNLVQPVSPQETAVWYDSNVKVDFSCPDEHMVGNHWWVCNPKHLNKIRGCTIYSSGPPVGLLVELALQELMPSCDIHVFDPSYSKTAMVDSDNSTATASLHVHPWGFSDRERTISNPNNTTMQLRTLQDTMHDLGHKSVDLLLVHCGGCEWSLDYGRIDQVLLVMNDVKDVNWFAAMTDKKYVMFHKQPIILGGVLGRGQALSFLKLRDGFFL